MSSVRRRTCEYRKECSWPQGGVLLTLKVRPAPFLRCHCCPATQLARHLLCRVEFAVDTRTLAAGSMAGGRLLLQVFPQGLRTLRKSGVRL